MLLSITNRLHYTLFLIMGLSIKTICLYFLQLFISPHSFNIYYESYGYRCSSYLPVPPDQRFLTWGLRYRRETVEVEVRAQKQESSIDFKQAFESRETSDTLMRISRFWRKDPQGLICTRHSFRHLGGKAVNTNPALLTFHSDGTNG